MRANSLRRQPGGPLGYGQHHPTTRFGGDHRDVRTSSPGRVSRCWKVRHHRKLASPSDDTSILHPTCKPDSPSDGKRCDSESGRTPTLCQVRQPPPQRTVDSRTRLRTPGAPRMRRRLRHMARFFGNPPLRLGVSLWAAGASPTSFCDSPTLPGLCSGSQRPLLSSLLLPPLGPKPMLFGGLGPSLVAPAAFSCGRRRRVACFWLERLLAVAAAARRQTTGRTPEDLRALRSWRQLRRSRTTTARSGIQAERPARGADRAGCREPRRSTRLHWPAPAACSARLRVRSKVNTTRQCAARHRPTPVAIRSPVPRSPQEAAHENEPATAVPSCHGMMRTLNTQIH